MTVPRHVPEWGARYGAALFLTSLVLLAMELVLVRIFSVLMWYHFVSLVVSLALFGLTVSALTVFLFPGRFPAEAAGSWLGRAALLLSFAILAQWCFFFFLGRSPRLAYRMLAPFHQPFYEPFGSPGGSALPLESLLPLSAIIIAAALPFLFGGLAVVLAIWHFSRDVTRVYFADLAGAGAGCLATFLVLTYLDPFGALGALAAAAALASLFFPNAHRRARAIRLLAAAALIAGSAITVAAARGETVRLKFVRGRYAPDILWDRWNSTSRVAVYPLRSGQAEGSWGMSRRYRGAVPPQLGMVVDDTGYSSIVRHSPDDDLSWARATLFALPYAIREEAATLIIGPGGGKEILVARSMGSPGIRAVEINPLMVRAVQEEFADFSGGPYSLPGVDTVIDEGRTFLRRDPSRYDVIQASALYGRMAPSAGAFTLTEDHLYTVEAFEDYLDRLKPDGLLAFSRFLFEKRILRLVATAATALERRGAEVPGAGIFIAAERGMATVLVKNAPFTAGELDLLEERCRVLGFSVLYSPRSLGSNPFERLLRAENVRDFYLSLDYDVTPVTDDRPFFYYLVRPADFFRTLTPLAGPDFDDRALILIRNLLLVMLLLVLSFVLLPLLLRGGGGNMRWSRSWAPLLFFASLGLGFIVVEVALLKQFILLLGRPVYSVAVILAAFLFAAGLGSYRSGGLARRPGLLRRRCGVLVMVLLLATFLIPAIIEGALHLSLPARILVTILTVAPLGYLMGQPFPLGVALLRARGEALIPWVWSLNGALSVLGSMATLVLAINFGYMTTMLVGPAAYLAAAVAAEELPS